MGWSGENSEPRRGERTSFAKMEFYRPFRGLWIFHPVPTACAVGYGLPPLRGWLRSSLAKVDLRHDRIITLVFPKRRPFGFVGENPAVVVGSLKLSGGGFIHHHGAPRMQLKRRGGDHRRDRAFHRLGNDVGLLTACSEQQTAARIQNRPHPHGDGAPGHLFFGPKKRRVPFE